MTRSSPRVLSLSQSLNLAHLGRQVRTLGPCTALETLSPMGTARHKLGSTISDPSHCDCCHLPLRSGRRMRTDQVIVGASVEPKMQLGEVSKVPSTCTVPRCGWLLLLTTATTRSDLTKQTEPVLAKPHLALHQLSPSIEAERQAWGYGHSRLPIYSVAYLCLFESETARVATRLKPHSLERATCLLAFLSPYLCLYYLTLSRVRSLYQRGPVLFGGPP